ncbi:hypothetical protein JKF63_05320 [Porcisia hertigi]|uniref:Coenzyme Q-binding protein COQ10 START domain-containing protein n=1 Tax=Porcisia hertigi TaxID=2761500 RepID=A0A836ITE1_9TRYP|nr:hypothetical protein JKF63_05320 [Porcisia hertigi]
MLRRVSSTSAFTYSSTGATAASNTKVMIGACNALYLDQRHCMTLTLSSAEAAATTAAARVTAIVTSQRTFTSSGSPGKDFLRHLTSSSKFTKAVLPLESLRPQSPPSASDARPFGSLNRTNSMRRYTNTNTAGPAGGSAGSEKEDAASLASSASPSTATTTPAPRRMELSRLLHRHPGGSPNFSASLTVSQNALHDTCSEEGLPKAQQKARNATVARAQAVIATAAVRRQADTTVSLSAPNASRTSPETVVGAASSAAYKLGSAEAPAKSGSSSSSSNSGSRHHLQVYKEHCTIGWSPEEFYQVVADVKNYPAFLPWCAGSDVHATRRVRVPLDERRLAANTTATPHLAAGSGVAEEGLVDAIEMITTLTIGFAFLKEKYTSRVTLYPCNKIVATLYDDEGARDEAALLNTNRASSAMTASSCDQNSKSGADSSGGLVLSFFKKAASTAGTVAKRSILQHLRCEWEFAPVEGKPNTVEVLFIVSFEFKNPLHSHMIMSNLVTLMTRSFERRCESLYGPPSGTKVTLPVLS